jgi:SAM-dependent methyltransferase
VSRSSRSALRRGWDRLRGASGRIVAAGDRVVFPDEKAPTRHWQRVVLNAAVDDYVASLHPSECIAAEISGSSHANRPWKEYTELTYPDFDLCAPLSDPGRFDVVICEQVLEHVPDPWAAVANLRELCAPWGRVIVSTPFLVRVHELDLFAMRDYWRFTPRGLTTLLEGAGLEVEAVGSWGNRQCVVGNLNRWSAYRPWHSLRNEHEFPVQVWAFARRPSDRG